MIKSYLIEVRLPAPYEKTKKAVMVTSGESLPVARLNAYKHFGLDRVVSVKPIAKKREWP